MSPEIECLVVGPSGPLAIQVQAEVLNPLAGLLTFGNGAILLVPGVPEGLFGCPEGFSLEPRFGIDGGDGNPSRVRSDSDGQVAPVILSTATAGAIGTTGGSAAIVTRAGFVLFNQPVALGSAEIFQRPVTRAAFPALDGVTVRVVVLEQVRRGADGQTVRTAVKVQGWLRSRGLHS